MIRNFVILGCNEILVRVVEASFVKKIQVGDNQTIQLIILDGAVVAEI